MSIKVTGIGRLTRDVELMYTPSGMAVGKFSIAVDKWIKNKEEKEANFFDCVCFDKTAESLVKYVGKGCRINLTNAELEQDRWQTEDGKNRSKVSIKIHQVDIVDFRDKDEVVSEPKMEPVTKQEKLKPPTDLHNSSNTDDDDIPF